EAADEMGLSLSELRSRLAGIEFYRDLFIEAFGDDKITDERIGKSMAQFVRSMVSYNAKYDQAFQAGQNGFPDYQAVFNESELLGQQLFERTALSVGCHECHVSPAQIGQFPRNIGLDLQTIDEGAGMGRFKVTSLRNVEVRGRFMHDGRFSTLEEVVDFYDNGIQPNPDVDELLLDNFPLNLTEVEKRGLVDFMKTMTDHEFLTSPLFSDPFGLLLGDVDKNGMVDKRDIAPFVQRLVAQEYQQEADLNLDTEVNLLDVPVFVDVLIGE
ncbi:MAG: cytochrome c peroxidase, partial [Planctomycetota bacterium]